MWRLRNLVLLLSILAVKPASAQFWVELFQSIEFLDNVTVNDSTYLEGNVRMTGLTGSGGTLMIDAEGDLYESTVTVGGLDPANILYGGSDGSINQNSSLYFTSTDTTLYVGGLSIKNNGATSTIISDGAELDITASNTNFYGSLTGIDGIYSSGDLVVGTFATPITAIATSGKLSKYATETPSNGELLIGDGTDMELSTITAGDGITITNGAGSITIEETNEEGANYTPTATNVTNTASIGTVYGRYFRDGNVVHVYIYTTAAATSGSALTEVSFSLPIASDFTVANDGYGSGSALSSANANGFPGRVYASAANDNVIFAWRPTSTATLEINFDFSYEIK